MGRMTKFTGVACGLGMVCAVAQPALAGGVSVSFRGRVPTICRVAIVDPAPLSLSAGDNRLGSTEELCNSVDGYRIVLDHPRGLVDAWVVVDGERIEIAPTATRTVIVESDQPGDGQRELGLHLSRPIDGPLPISLYAEAKGMIY